MAEWKGRGPGSQSALRGANLSRVLDVLAPGTSMTQAELARETGLAAATVSNIVRDLEERGWVTVRSRGRRRYVELAAQTGLLGAVDYGHRHVTVALSRRPPEVLTELRAELDLGVTAADSLGTAHRLLTEALGQLGADCTDLIGVGLGLPAPVDSRTGKVGSPTILPGWVGVHAAALAERAFGVPVVVDNDANLAALAEYRWGGTDAENLVYLKLSEGVGAGLIIDGMVFSGPGGTAGEIGHTTVEEFGAMCRCGNRGCLETFVSARAVANLLAPITGPDISMGTVVQRALEGDHACARVLSDTGVHVGHAVADLCNLINPERVLIGGELAQAGDLLISPILQVLLRCGIPSAVNNMVIEVGRLGPQAPVLGGLALADDRLVRPL